MRARCSWYRRSPHFSTIATTTGFLPKPVAILPYPPFGSNPSSLPPPTLCPDFLLSPSPLHLGPGLLDFQWHSLSTTPSISVPRPLPTLVLRGVARRRQRGPGLNFKILKIWKLPRRKWPWKMFGEEMLNWASKSKHTTLRPWSCHSLSPPVPLPSVIRPPDQCKPRTPYPLRVLVVCTRCCWLQLAACSDQLVCSSSLLATRLYRSVQGLCGFTKRRSDWLTCIR